MPLYLIKQYLLDTNASVGLEQDGKLFLCVWLIHVHQGDVFPRREFVSDVHVPGNHEVGLFPVDVGRTGVVFLIQIFDVKRRTNSRVQLREVKTEVSDLVGIRTDWHQMGQIWDF